MMGGRETTTEGRAMFRLAAIAVVRAVVLPLGALLLAGALVVALADRLAPPGSDLPPEDFAGGPCGCPACSANFLNRPAAP
jgi:hypothetical protein